MDLRMRTIREALRYSRQHFSREGYKDSEYAFMMEDPDWYEVDSKETADFLGFEWIGRPYVHIPRQHHGGYDAWWHVFEWIEVVHYILSGQRGIDECRAYDEMLLASAR